MLDLRAVDRDVRADRRVRADVRVAAAGAGPDDGGAPRSSAAGAPTDGSRPGPGARNPPPACRRRPARAPGGSRRLASRRASTSPAHRQPSTACSRTRPPDARTSERRSETGSERSMRSVSARGLSRQPGGVSAACRPGSGARRSVMASRRSLLKAAMCACSRPPSSVSARWTSTGSSPMNDRQASSARCTLSVAGHSPKRIVRFHGPPSATARAVGSCASGSTRIVASSSPPRRRLSRWWNRRGRLAIGNR